MKTDALEALENLWKSVSDEISPDLDDQSILSLPARKDALVRAIVNIETKEDYFAYASLADITRKLYCEWWRRERAESYDSACELGDDDIIYKSTDEDIISFKEYITYDFNLKGRR